MKKAVIGLSIIITILLIGSGFSFFLTNNKLNAIQYELQTAQNTIVSQTNDLNNDSAKIIELQSGLDSKNTELDTKNKQLNELQRTADETAKELAIAEDKIDNLNSQFTSTMSQLNSTKSQIDTLNSKLSDAQSKIDLFKSTFGNVNSNIEPLGIITDGTVKNGMRLFNLKRNLKATDPSWLELVKFLANDTTDTKPYVERVYTCGNYAEDVFNNAEANGIRTAIVCIYFQNQKDGHALNAFKTTDSGLLYIDCTGNTGSMGITGVRMDTRVQVKLGGSYIRTFVFPCSYYFESMGTIRSIDIYW
jgi:hypothetical protein